MAEAHKWEFKARFRRRAFGWKSQPAITRITQAVAEIKKVAKKEPMLAAEGAVAFLARVSPALEHVDSSSGSIGTARADRERGLFLTEVARRPRERLRVTVWDAYRATIVAAERRGVSAEVKERVRKLVAAEHAGGFVKKVLGLVGPPTAHCSGTGTRS